MIIVTQNLDGNIRLKNILQNLKFNKNNEILNIVIKSHKKYHYFNGVKVKNIIIPLWLWKLKALEAEFGIFGRLLRKYVKKEIKGEPTLIFLYQIYLWNSVKDFTPKTKIIVDIPEDLSEILGKYEHNQRFPLKLFFSQRKWELLQHNVVANAEKVLLTADEAVEFYKFKYRKIQQIDKFIRIRNCVSPSNFPNFSGIPKRNYEIKKYQNLKAVYFGDTGFRRGVQDFIIAVSKLKTVYNITVEFKIIGYNSKNDAYLKKLIQSEGVDSNIRHLGFKGLDEAGKEFKKCDFGVSPLHENIHHDNTLANKVFQYTYFGLPILMSDVNAQYNYALTEKSNALIYKSGNIEDLVFKLKYLHENRLYLHQLHLNCRDMLNHQKLENELYPLQKIIDYYQ